MGEAAMAVAQDDVKTAPRRTRTEIVGPAIAPAGNPLLGMLGQLATNPSFSVEAFQAVVGLLKEEKAAQAMADFRRDFAAFQSEMPSINKGGKGHNGKPHERLEDIFEGTKELRQKYGFSLNHSIKQDANSITIIAVLGHRGGHEMTAEMRLPLDSSGSKNAVQAHGSTMTYGKRYTAMAVLGLAASDEADDDGKASGKGETIDADQIAQIRSLIVETGSDIAKFCAMGGVDTIEDITKESFAKAIGLLEDKKRRARK